MTTTTMVRPRRWRRLATGALALSLTAAVAAAQAPIPQPGSGGATAAAAPIDDVGPQAAPGVGPSYSPSLGIFYRLEPYGRAYGARLTQPPRPDSPLAQPQIQLEAGDLIVGLDGVAITGPHGLEAHVGQTQVTFVNIRTGLREARWCTLSGPHPGPYPPGPYPPYPGGLTLGVQATPAWLPATVPGPRRLGLQIVAVTPGSPAAQAGLRTGELIVSAGGTPTPDVHALRAAIARSGGVLPLSVVTPWGRHRQVTAYLGSAAVIMPFGAAGAPRDDAQPLTRPAPELLPAPLAPPAPTPAPPR